MNTSKYCAKLFQDGCKGLLELSHLQGIDPELLMAVLSSFITSKNVVVTTDSYEASSFVQRWLELIAANIIGVEDVVTVTFHPHTTWKEVEEALMSVNLSRYYYEIPKTEHRPESSGDEKSDIGYSRPSSVFTSEGTTRYPSRYGSVSYESGQDDISIDNSIVSEKRPRSTLPRFIILKDLDEASREIQSLFVQGLVRKKLIFNGVEYPFPHFSVIVALINLKRGKGFDGLMPHLKDLFFFSHHMNLEEWLNCTLTKDEIRERVKALPNIQPAQLVTADMIREAVERIGQVVIIPEIRVYMQDIIVFFANTPACPSRARVSPKAVQDFERFLRILCVIENSDFATPSLVAKAARKVFPLKVEMCRSAEDEPTLNYGSDINLISKWIKKWDVELIIEDVLNIVPAPL